VPFGPAQCWRERVFDSFARAEKGDQCTGLELLPLLCAACVLSITKCLLLVAVPELPERKGRVLARTAGLEQGSKEGLSALLRFRLASRAQRRPVLATRHPDDTVEQVAWPSLDGSHARGRGFKSLIAHAVTSGTSSTDASETCFAFMRYTLASQSISLGRRPRLHPSGHQDGSKSD
jgi:hypothetical protein